MIVWHVEHVSMNVQLVLSLKVISIKSIQKLVQNVVHAQVYAHLKQFTQQNKKQS